MATHAFIQFTLFVCACIYTEVECVTCSNMLECTMYNIQQVGSKVDGMQSNMAAIVSQLSQIQGAINRSEDLEQRMKALEGENNQLKEESDDLQLRMVVLEQEIQNQNTPFVSFRAFPAESRTYYGGGKIVLFDSVEVNLGLHYNAEESTFICPYDAYYLFMVTVQNGDGKRIKAWLRLEETYLQRVYAVDSVTDDQSTIVVVTLCQAGQRVWVSYVGSADNDVYGQYKSSCFSGSVLRTL